MSASLIELFRTEIETFLTDQEMDPTAFGRRALNDPNFVFDIRDGRSPSAKTIDRARAFMAQHVLASASTEDAA